MKKIAIIGGGLAGLSTAYFLLESQKAAVTLFESLHIGAGASGVCSGLLHPYPGLSVRRSYLAEEGLLASKQLLRLAQGYTPKPVALESGILRQSLNLEQKTRLLEHCAQWKDIERIGEDLFLIHSGITVNSAHYLEGLFYALQAKGLEFVQQAVHTLEELKSFDHVIIAAGYGVMQFPECQNLKIKFLKGQALTLEGDPPYEKSFISKGYIAHFGQGSTFELGSTYEREFTDEAPDCALAQKLLQDKIAGCPGAKVLKCRAGVRVMALGQYLPLIEKVAENVHVFTGLGSRGLLYHALYAKALCAEVLF